MPLTKVLTRDLCINVCFIKIRSKHSSNTLLSVLQIFKKQTLLLYVIKLKTTRIESVYDLKKVLCILRVLLKQTKMNLTVV